ncbi:hypothetical protein Fleli_2801 [Bernardetia litoralis DSM 6794]|uniref:Uncharacterized protein n=1 Tax=Bernardetia litoralis (strain ATCC 23117 / DSM 6794 / NBRC 15988 / NCIMB 1366 / Fx l1 / Sio-4) TaxID=880071 RepID=I4AMG9_BERLS|nr:hypothetical protein [Bernardetia litoralis]AFM05154.1 hypothetical protein Fleli_2801 [Bernardetia litoralis DSM 6794]
MKKFVLSILYFLLTTTVLLGQSKKNDISPQDLPKEVKNVLNQYIEILEQANNLDECAEMFAKIAGGSLVSEDGQSLGNDVKPYSLKKDFQNIKFYHTTSIKITRVNVKNSNGMGFGYSAIRGKVYKIWIGKKQGVSGMPAPISIMIPEGHSEIKTPKVVGIGSL